MVKKNVFDFNLPEINENDFNAENFESLFDDQKNAKVQGAVVKGVVVSTDEDCVVVDAGLKSEGKISKREFGNDEIKVGDLVDVFVDRYETRDGSIVLSREKARREEVWVKLEKIQEEGTIIKGRLLDRIKGGFSVDVDGLIAFMPGSQIDIVPVKDLNAMVGKELDVLVLKMDRVRSNIIVSHRAILEEERTKQRAEIIKTIKVGDVLDGVVKNITDYGVFVDLGGVDGLLHVTDISWKRIFNPSEVLSLGQNIKVKVISYDEESQKVSLGMKQLEKDPWEAMSSDIKAGNKVKGKVTNLADYGAFIELETGVEGLIHSSELSWTNKNIHPSKVVSIGDEVEVLVLEIDEVKRRISLGLKQCSENPWAKYGDSNKVGDVIKGKIKNVTEFGIFVDLGDDLTGMVHLSDISWEKSGEEAIKDFSKDQEIEAKILDIDLENQRISLGIKQMDESKASSSVEGLRKGATVTCVIKAIDEKELTVEVEGTEATIKKIDLSKERSEQRTDRFAEGEKIDAKVVSVEKKTGKIKLSVKALEADEERKAMEKYGSSETGAVLGDILGVALEEAKSKK
ncbi:MAG: 30S ribosomal protein S1 [Alphaproteobacteria bacterium]|jgi:small subunit ribosomal protein S1|nr:30S ribosomal protein S1 [Alphaproteobacteria bacterium]